MDMQRDRTNLVLARKSLRKASAQFACYTWAAGSRVNDVVTGKGRTVWRCVSPTSKNELKKRKQCICFGSIFPLVHFGIFLPYIQFMSKNKGKKQILKLQFFSKKTKKNPKKQILPRPRLNHRIHITSRGSQPMTSRKKIYLNVCLDSFAFYNWTQVSD